ncbi:hypothetical protein B0J13DRAFT_327157 [Dactylonectria estremocensis]|uniref:HTH APSES-type domain-containing protein n=1 Tax=Dactylonectria estremocensis TaxID=1079267 RepID=A0A9P9EV07_9HYPO|nr:hypothetical protein B0J13DRAFT_327157 [Dactylonectria estremocensis]
MLSLKTLLNPASPGREHVPSFRPSPTLSSPTSSASIHGMAIQQQTMHANRNSTGRTNLSKSKIRAPVNYPPYEKLDGEAVMELRRFRIQTFGFIQQSCSHIPYNSGKKGFFEKTGRESFEVFRYEFTLPGENTEFTVMWDYNVGLVRMTPFFKCCRYGKTVPAKMLGLNPGLKDISHSITGGSIAAQGYWMPYSCAKAVCATFCYHIAGALIPIFGPSFPGKCFRPDSLEFGRMTIDPQLIGEATHEAEFSRRQHMNNAAAGFNGATSFPRNVRPSTLSPFDHEECKFQLRPRLTCDSSWTPEDAESSYCAVPNSASSIRSGPQGYSFPSRPGSSWAPANHPSPQYDLYPDPSPYLSAVPSIPSFQPRNTSSPPGWSPKRRLNYEDSDHGYRTSASPIMGSMGNTTHMSITGNIANSDHRSNTRDMRLSSLLTSGSPGPTPTRERTRAIDEKAEDAAAVLLLLGGKEQDRESPPTAAGLPPIVSPAPGPFGPWFDDGHARKRQRTDSF